MNSRIQYLINYPFEVQLSDVALLQEEIERYPYFSTLRTLLLFGLKEFDHASYQDELKKTSIYSPSRAALYHYLQKEKQPSTEEMKAAEVVAEEPISESPKEEKAAVDTDHAETGTDFIPEEKVTENKLETTNKADVTHSEYTFSEWLSISKSQSEHKENQPSEKDIKFQLIDEFIEKSPKISPVSKTQEISHPAKRTESSNEYSDLMTETLAQIYTEQKKFDKAVRAYKILSLKYPEKSDFFADKIAEIENLKNS